MPKDLKDAMRDRCSERAEELGEPDFVDKIADETVTTEAEGLVEWMAKVDHPALKMPPLLYRVRSFHGRGSDPQGEVVRQDRRRDARRVGRRRAARRDRASGRRGERHALPFL